MHYEIVRSGRRTVAISVKEGRVILRAPYSLKENDADKIISAHLDWINKKLSEQSKREDKPTLTQSDIRLFRKEARKYFSEKLEYYSNVMNLKYNRMNITGAKTRFGSCSSKGNISFSYLLMLYPEPAREYVVVHELSHLLEMNH